MPGLALYRLGYAERFFRPMQRPVRSDPAGGYTHRCAALRAGVAVSMKEGGVKVTTYM